MSSSQFEQASEAPRPLLPQASVRGSSRWLPLFGAGLGLLGLIAGVAGCGRPVASSEAAKPVYSDQQVVDAKKAVCEAYARGMQALRTSGGKKVENPADKLPIAVNTRLAEVAMSNFLINTLMDNPATEPELRDSAKTLAQTYQEMALIQLADGSTSDYETQARITDDLVPKINQICQ
jgi:hypothetical protein